MKGLLNHLALTIKLNFRSAQALVYGYIVPVFFLVAFQSVFHNDKQPVIQELGELLTITVLGGACFGLPTSIVSERERGVWRRYRLLPAATGGLIVSTMVARILIVLSAAIVQIVLAMLIYQMPAPQYPLQMLIAFVFVCFAFLGMGLVIAMVAENVPAVQALGQAIFLPMIMVGGIGFPLRSLPVWAQHVAAFMPGRYAAEALKSCAVGSEQYRGFHGIGFELIALTIIGASGCFAGAKLFRWDMGQKLTAKARAWLVPAIASWALVGIITEVRGKAVLYRPPPEHMQTIAKIPIAPPIAPRVATTQSGPTTAVASTTAPIASTTAPSGPPAAWQDITPAQISGITYDDLEPDNGTVTPVMDSLDGLDDDGKKRIQLFTDKLQDWSPGMEPNLAQRLRNYLSVAAVADLLQDELEGAFPYVIFDKLKFDIPTADLEKGLTYIILTPDDGKVVTSVSELGIEGDTDEAAVRQRTTAYAKKLLYRLLAAKGKPS